MSKDVITQSQFNSWKKEEAGKLYYNHLKAYKEAVESNLKALSTNVSQEELYKWTTIFLTQLELVNDLLEMKAEDLYKFIGEEDEEQTTGNK